MSRIEQPPAHLLLNGSGPPTTGSGLDPVNGDNNPWRWDPANEWWVSEPVDVTWSSGATIASFAPPSDGLLYVIVGTSGTNPFELNNNQPEYFAGTGNTYADGTVSASAAATATAAGQGQAFLAWTLSLIAGTPASGFVGDSTDILPPETRTIADILGSDFTISPTGWDDGAVGNLGDFYLDNTTLATTVDLYGPRGTQTWGAPARLGGVLTSPDGSAYRLVVSNAGVLSTEPA